MAFPFGQHIQSTNVSYLSKISKSNDKFLLKKDTPYYIECFEDKSAIFFNDKELNIFKTFPGFIYTPTENGNLQGESILIVSEIKSLFSKLSKIGIQAGAGQLFCLNKYGLRVDESGTFEYEGDINFIGFIPGTSSETFILDYKE